MRMRPTSRQLAVASFLLDLDRGAKTDELLLKDEDLVLVTGYSIRSVQMAWSELVEDGAVFLERSRSGVRTAVPDWSHPVFTMAELQWEAQP